MHLDQICRSLSELDPLLKIKDVFSLAVEGFLSEQGTKISALEIANNEAIRINGNISTEAE